MKGVRKRWLFASLISISVLLLAGIGYTLNHKAKQPRPIKLGVSGSNINDNCAAGTLGSLVKNAYGKRFILSNNHVLADENRAAKGDLIIQPGSLDDNCRFRAINKVARLGKYIPIKFSATANNLVDAAIARTIAGKVDSGGTILAIGRVGGEAVNPAIGMRVKKAGRTTGVTSGRIVAVGVTVKVGYASGRVARFTNQFVVSPGSFSSPGDSGSLIVKRTSACPAPVGLLFAGSSSYTVANPIKTVYSKLRVKPVGCAASSAEESQMSNEFLSNEALVVQAQEVKARHEDELLKIPGVQAVGIGEENGEVVIKVFIKKANKAASRQRAIPDKIDGFRIVPELTEEFKSF